MAQTASTMMPLGTLAPSFLLKDVVSENLMSLEDVRGERGLLVMFICVHCPYVIHIQDRLVEIANHFLKKGVGAVAISSNDTNNYPQDGPQFMRKQAIDSGFNFPYLFDEKQVVAKDYMAACTPDLYLFDHELKCYYRGRLDASTPKNNMANDGSALQEALEALLSGEPPPLDQIPSMGCNIKWKA
jgi:peroxiredoxin